MTALLGVDGGQSGFRMQHSAVAGFVEVEGLSRRGGDPTEMVGAALTNAWSKAGFPPARRVVLGLTTAPADRAGADRLCDLVAATTGAHEVLLTDDAVTGHAGALSGRPGVSIVAGTGVATMALPEVGDARIIGGHGYLLGDDGGGFWIGRAGLRAVLRGEDGRGPATSLKEAAHRRFGNLDDLHVRLHDQPRPVNEIGQFAPDVMDAADANDRIALGIVDEAARELLALAAAGARWVGGVGVPVALGGRILAPGTAVRRRLDRLLGDSTLSLVPRSAEASPLEGAMLLGQDELAGRYGKLVHIWPHGAAS
jgi:glucosamine kinase